MSKLIAIDFDGTITEKVEYPLIGSIRDEAIDYIKKLYEDGYTLALWTSRDNSLIKNAIERLEDAHILQYFTYINDDGKEQDNRKIDADFYIDDKSFLSQELDWKSIYNYITHNI